MSDQYQQRKIAAAVRENRCRTTRFAQLSSPTEEALYDPHRFVAKYFLDGLHGKPCPDKTRKPLILGQIDQAKLRGIVQQVPHLAIRTSIWTTVVCWKDNFESGLDEAFASLSAPGVKFDVPTAEAQFDINRFLAKYFLDGLEGKPAPQKTVEPLELYPFGDPGFAYLGERLQQAVALIPGLHLCYAWGIYSSDMTIIIGWNYGQVHLRKREIEVKAAAEKSVTEKAEREEIWQRKLCAHYEYLQNYQPPTGPLKLERLSGKYIVKCEKLDGCNSEDEMMTLHIHPPSERSSHGVLAAFEFGILEGTMLLAMSDDALHQLRQDVDVPSGRDGHESDHLDSDPCLTDSREQKAEASPEPTPTKRRILGGRNRPNRVCLQWAGRETGEGEIQVDTENENVGYLVFDEARASAQGKIAYPHYYGDVTVEFAIHKVSDQPTKAPEPWSRFSEEQHNYESSARWGRW